METVGMLINLPYVEQDINVKEKIGKLPELDRSFLELEDVDLWYPQ